MYVYVCMQHYRFHKTW